MIDLVVIHILQIIFLGHFLMDFRRVHICVSYYDVQLCILTLYSCCELLQGSSKIISFLIFNIEQAPCIYEDCVNKYWMCIKIQVYLKLLLGLFGKHYTNWCSSYLIFIFSWEFISRQNPVTSLQALIFCYMLWKRGTIAHERRGSLLNFVGTDVWTHLQVKHTNGKFYSQWQW